MTRFYDEGSSGGNVGSPQGDGSANANVGSSANAGSPEGAGSGTQSIGSGNTGTAQSKALQDELAQYKQQVEKYKKTVGDQGTQIGQLRTFQESVRNDPKGFISRLAKESGIPVKILEQNNQISDAFNSGDPNQQAGAVSQSLQSVQDQVQRMAPHVRAAYEATMRQKYPNWDDFADTRETLKLSAMGGTIHEDEQLQLMAIGMNVGEAIEAAKLEAIESYKKELAAKNAEQVSDPTKVSVEPADADKEFDTLLQSLEQ
jgi:hypothetical protein